MKERQRYFPALAKPEVLYVRLRETKRTLRFWEWRVTDSYGNELKPKFTFTKRGAEKAAYKALCWQLEIYEERLRERLTEEFD